MSNPNMDIVEYNGRATVFIRTAHSMAWWKYLAECNETVAQFVKKYGGAGADAAFTYALLSYNDADVVALLTLAFEQCPDEVTARNSGELDALTMVYRLIEDKVST